MQNFLTYEERNTLAANHRKERDKRIFDRIKAVLLFDEGWTYQEIAHVLLLSDEVIRQHVQEYEASRKLNEQQTKALLEHLQNHLRLKLTGIAKIMLFT